MPRFLIERNFVEEVEVTKEEADNIRRINDDEGVSLAVLIPEPGQAKNLLPV